MSISPDSHLAPRPLAEQALALLKGKPNPFESLTRPQRAEDGFRLLHHDGLHDDERRLLLSCINSYRLDEYSDGAQLKNTRSVLVLGDRGSGKTHLLQSLVDRSDRLAQLVLRPSLIDPGARFEEYLLTQLRIALGDQDEFHQHRPIELIARTLSRRLLLQALRHATPTDALVAMKGGGSPLWWGGEVSLPRWRSMLSLLEDKDSRNDLPGVLERGGLPGRVAVRLVDGYLRKAEAGAGGYALLRRRFYSHLVRSAVLGDLEGLGTFLREGYANAVPGLLSRQELVDHMLQVLLESCALVRMPVVVAFDNFERLVAPQGQFDGALAGGFIQDIAQAIDTTKGLLFLLFVESGMWDANIAPSGVDEFARGRLGQGVSLPKEGAISQVKLPAVDDVQIGKLVRSRVQALLGELPEAATLPPLFPFDMTKLTDLTASGVNLRNILHRLRDEYQQTLHPSPVVEKVDVVTPIKDPPLPLLFDVLERTWNRALSQVTGTAHEHADLAACLGSLAQNLLVGTTHDGWKLGSVTPSLQVGEHPAYGILTTLYWKADETRPPSPSYLFVAVGFLLASGPGMAYDLRAKFDLFGVKKKGYRLVILQPGDNASPDNLPQGTRAVWDANSAHHWRTEIRPVPELLLRRIRAFVRCRDLVEQETGETVPQADLFQLMKTRGLDTLLPLLLPPSSGGDE